MASPLERRAQIHAALGEPHRLAIVEELAWSDRTPTQLGDAIGLPSNLVAHHLDVLEEAELIERFASTADRRRRYIRLLHEPLDRLAGGQAAPPGPILFVCTGNSARSQLAAALWTDRTGRPADSAGTTPAHRVHPMAVAAARRAGLSLRGSTPTRLDDEVAEAASVVVTVCDQAYEELTSPAGWWHWSTPDPVLDGTDEAFDATIAQLDQRISAFQD
ncbi:MAG: helix-turn-helix domain-containing protein [Actinomycetota bacterium]